jgi:hypothetical protein
MTRMAAAAVAAVLRREMFNPPFNSNPIRLMGTP